MKDRMTTSSHGFARTTLPNGIVLLTQARPQAEVITGIISIAAGHLSSGTTVAGLPAITASMLNRGTPSRSFEHYNQELDALGAMVGTSGGARTLDVVFTSLAEDVRTVLGIVADIIRNPIFPHDQLELVRQQALTGLKEAERDTGTMATRAVTELLYPEGDLRRIRSSGTEASLTAISPADLQAYHAAHVGPRVTTISVVGGFADVDAAAGLIGEVLGDWAVDVPEALTPQGIEPLPATLRADRIVPESSQADMVIWQPTIPRSHADYLPLSMGNLILGELGLMGRLGGEVRDKHGLAYYAGSSISGGIVTSLWTARAGVAPANIGRALEGIRQELERIRQEPVSENEHADATSSLIGSLPLRLEAMGGVARLLLEIERHDLGQDYLGRYPGLIRAITRDDILRAMATHLDPARLAIGVAGPAAITEG